MTNVTRVKVMADYASSGIWDEQSYEALDPQALGLSTELCDALKAWIGYFNANSEDWLPLSEQTGKLDYARLTREGRLLALRVKQERPDLAVFFFDEEKLHKQLVAQSLARNLKDSYLVEV